MKKPPKTILILGATSSIAQATARLLAREDSHFFLVGRNESKLKVIAADLEQRTQCKAETYAIELKDTSTHADLVEIAIKSLESKIDLTLIAYGTLPDQESTQEDPEATLDSLEVNFNSPASLLTRLAMHYQEQESGTIAVITSVAADRGRKTLYTYCSAKAALSTFTDGLRGRLLPHKVQVLNIKPGVVDTPMTAHLKKGLLATTPKKVAEDILKAIKKKKDVLYTPGRWWWIMFIIRHIPEKIFKKLSI